MIATLRLLWRILTEGVTNPHRDAYYIGPAEAARRARKRAKNAKRETEKEG